MIPDPIELTESRIEDLAFERFTGVPVGYFRCYGCKQVVSDSEMNTASASPDAPAVCEKCLQKIYGNLRP